MDTTETLEAATRRAHVHGMWAAVAGSWRDHANDVDARGAAIAAQMLDRVALRSGERVLELACGPGGVGIAAAERVGPTGEVVVSDVVAEMASIAGERARARGLGNVRSAVLDLEAIDEPDASFDVVVCREGLMFATEPGRATDEIGRVLRPAGRVAVAVWGPREQNPWLALVFDAMSAQLGMPLPPPGIPGPFALDDTQTVTRLFSEHGFTDVTVTEVSVPLHADGFTDWWTRTRALAGPLASIVASLPEDAAAELARRLEDALIPYRTLDGLTLPGVSLLATARLP